MATRNERLSKFDKGPPPADKPLELLCEDHAGTYVLPYLCEWRDGVWRSTSMGTVIEATVVGWRITHRP
jgi:hypothetical protein